MAVMTRATRRQFSIAFDMGCGAATAHGACGFRIAVQRMRAPIIRDGKIERMYTCYVVAGATFRSTHRTLRGALNAVSRKFASQPVWRPFVDGGKRGAARA